ncbi:MAG: hypothetical protein E7162_02875 [Firmicutes bacterium]|nr:hypothetical protein [Bacillota bacterium]
MLYILILFLLFLLLFGIGFYYYRLINRIISVFNKDILKKKRILILLVIIFTLLSINLFSIIGVFFMHFICISLIIDLIYLIFKKFIKNKKIINIYKLCLLPLMISIIVLGYGFINMINIVETKYTIYTDKEIGEDIRVLLLTDSHYGDIFKKSNLDKLKKRLDEVSADVVILGGDIVDEGTTKEEMEYIFKVFGSIKNKYGIYFVYGNHDEQQYNMNRKYSYDELNEAITTNNIYILNDNYMPINSNIVIAGRNDYSMGRKDIDTYLDVSKDNYLIMVDHQPVEYLENIDFGIDLIVSGHTHGGQIFPIEMFIKLFHTADLSYGYGRFDNMDVIVSSGVAGWGYPIRTSHNSEYVVIDIKKSN